MPSILNFSAKIAIPCSGYHYHGPLSLTIQCTVYNVQCTMYSVQCTVYNVQCTMYSVQCTVYNVQCTMYSVQCTVYNVQCTMYSVQCTVYNVQCTMYSVQCILYKNGEWLLSLRRLCVHVMRSAIYTIDENFLTGPISCRSVYNYCTFLLTS